MRGQGQTVLGALLAGAPAVAAGCGGDDTPDTQAQRVGGTIVFGGLLQDFTLEGTGADYAQEVEGAARFTVPA
jgi:hypothetical protein